MKKAPSGAFLMFRRHLGIIYMECLDRSESAPRQIDPIPQFSTLLKLLSSNWRLITVDTIILKPINQLAQYHAR